MAVSYGHEQTGWPGSLGCFSQPVRKMRSGSIGPAISANFSRETTFGQARQKFLYTMKLPSKLMAASPIPSSPTALRFGAICLLATAFAGCVTEEAYHRPRRTTVIVEQAPPPPPPRVIVEAPPPRREVIIVHEAPPPPRREVIIERNRPSRDHVWVKGYWVWRGSRHVWVDGHWERPPRPHAVWVEPRWERRPEGHIFIEGYWR